MAGLSKVDVHIRGLVPTIMNNGRLANPTDSYAKAIKRINDGKGRGKVLPDDKMEELLRLQFLGGLYVDEEGCPCWPGENLEALLNAGARKFRKGKDSLVGLIVDGSWPLIYDGSKDPEKLWERKEFRKVVMAKRGGSPVLTCRPIFHIWELKFDIHYDSDVLNGESVIEWLKVAGVSVGLSDWRPKYGRYEVLSVE